MTDLVILFGLHFVSDFICQSRDMGRKKSEDLKVLLQHGGIIWLVFVLYRLFGSFTALDDISLIYFATIYASFHCIQDWFVWKGYKWSVWYRLKDNKPLIGSLSLMFDREGWIKDRMKAWEYWKDRWFYTTIGFDQMLHYITIILVYKWVIL